MLSVGSDKIAIKKTPALEDVSISFFTIACLISPLIWKEKLYPSEAYSCILLPLLHFQYTPSKKT